MLHLKCPRCGSEYSDQAHLEQVTFVGNGNNVVIPCPACGLEWDATGGGDGTFSSIGGRLVRVARTLAAADRAELERLRAEVERIARAQDRDAAVTAARDIGWEPASKSRLTTGNEALDFVIKLQVVITILLHTGEWTVETVQKLLEQWAR